MKKKIEDKWMYRVIEVFKGKELNPTITNNDCRDILNDEFGCDFDESAWRKKYQSAMIGFEYAKKEIGNGEMTKEEGERLIKNIAKGRTRTMLEQKITTEMRKQLHTDVRFLGKYKIIDEAMLALSDYKYREIKFTTVASLSGKDIPVYSIADLHYGLEIKLRNNVFSPEVAKERMNKVIDFIVRDIKHNKYDEFIIFEAGDIIEGSGNLRASQWLATTMSMMEQSVNVADFMTSFYLEINSRLSKIKRDIKGSIYMVSSSNHTQLRIGNTKRDEVENDDISIMIASMIRKNVESVGKTVFTRDIVPEKEGGKDYEIEFHVADEHLVDIKGVKVFLTHGHKYKHTANIHDTLARMEHVLVDIVFSGHYHSLGENTIGSRGNINKKKIYLPSICGDTHYTRNLQYSSAPGALKSIFNEKNGNVGNILIAFD